MQEIKCLEAEKAILSSKVIANKREQSKLESILTNPAYQELLSHDYLVEDEFTKWMFSDYPKNPNYKENLVHDTVHNLKVRSKAESMIAIALDRAGIPFRYEFLMEIQGIPFYPDFTIVHPRTKKLFRWEHFGIMDDSSYIREFESKIPIYTSNGLIPGVDLIMSFETKNRPLTYLAINNLINLYLQ